jgi:methylglutamate dehydrogenase subunit B
VRIPCPFCGERDSSEFVCLGDATIQRPDSALLDAAKLFFEAVYLRDNLAGPHQEWWYHGLGCRSWLKVARDTRTHEIFGVRFAIPHLADETPNQ